MSAAPSLSSLGGPRMTRLESVRTYWLLLAEYAKPYWRKAVLIALLLVASLSLQLLSPQILRKFIDSALTSGVHGIIPSTAGLYVAVVVLSQLLYAPATYLMEDMSWRSTNALREDLMLHSLSLDVGFHKRRTPGEMIERIDGDVSELANFMSQFVTQIVANAFLLLGVLGILFFVDWRVGLILTCYVAAALGVLLPFHGRGTPHFRTYRQSVAELSGFWEETLGATEDIRANGAEPYIRRRNFALMRISAALGRKAQLLFRAYIGAIAAVFVLGTVVAFVVSVELYSRGLITIGTIFMILSYTGILTTNLQSITDQVGDLQRAAGSIERVRELRQIASAITDGPGEPLPVGPLSVEFSGVTFAYDDGKRALDDVNFDLAPGEVLGVLGRTGSGKTTLARLLFRFYDPDDGFIQLGGVDVGRALLEDLRERIGFVTQDVQLFHASLRDNLTLFDADIPDDVILAKLDALGLTGWYSRLGEGLDTLLAGNAAVSAGEAQLLAFVRVFLRDPGLVVMDEASSRLDPATEYMIERAVDELLRDRTAIVIAHRLSTIERSDKVLILEQGRVAEYGSYAELAAGRDSNLSALLAVSEGVRVS